LTGKQLEALVAAKNFTQQRAADLIGITRQTLQNWIRDGVPLSKGDFVAKILNDFQPTGKDLVAEKENTYNKLYKDVKELDKLRSQRDPNFKQEIKQVNFDSFMEVNYLSIQAQAGYLDSMELNIEPKLDTMLIPREFEKGNYLIIEVAGNSLDDGTARSIQDGDKLLVKELIKEHWRNKLHYKTHLFVIVSSDGIVCKQVIDHDVQNGIITCHSWNNLYKDYIVNLNDVYKLFYVKKIVERRIKF